MGYHRDAVYDVPRAFRMRGVEAFVAGKRGPRRPRTSRGAPEAEPNPQFRPGLSASIARTNKIRSPRTNGFDERAKRTPLHEYFRVQRRQLRHTGVGAIQRDFDRMLRSLWTHAGPTNDAEARRRPVPDIDPTAEIIAPSTAA